MLGRLGFGCLRGRQHLRWPGFAFQAIRSNGWARAGQVGSAGSGWWWTLASRRCRWAAPPVQSVTPRRRCPPQSSCNILIIMLQLYLQYKHQHIRIRDSSYEFLKDSILADEESVSQDFGTSPFKRQFSGTIEDDHFILDYDLNYEIIQEEYCCSLLKNFSSHQGPQPTKMVLGLAIPEVSNYHLNSKGYDIIRLLDSIRGYFKQINYIRLIKDVDYNYNDEYRGQSLVIFVFHEEQHAQQFIAEMNCFMLSKERQEYLYLLPLQRLVFLPYWRSQTLEPEEHPLDVAQQLALLGEGFLTLLPKCVTCIEKIEGSISGIDYSKQRDLQEIYSNPLRWLDQKKLCRVCQVVYKDDDKQAVCQICKQDQDVWICLICGNLGCGRYKLTHAQGHQLQTNHIFSLELLTGRLWDYNLDNFVHRIVKGYDKSILNLPDSQSVDSGHSSKQNQEQQEQIILESCFEMTRQMEAQRQYYESLIEEEKQNQESDTQIIEYKKQLDRTQSQLITEEQKQKEINNRLAEVRKHKKTLQSKLSKMNEDIEQSQYLKMQLESKYRLLEQELQTKHEVNPKSKKVIEEEERKLNQLEQQLAVLYQSFE